MKKTLPRLFQSLECLSTNKLSAFARFLDSPYFNQREDVGQLLQWYIHHRPIKTLDKAMIWAAVYPGQDFEMAKFRLLSTYLQRLLERFLAAEMISEDKALVKYKAAQWSQRNESKELMHILLNEATKLSNKSPYRGADYYQLQYELAYESYIHHLIEKPYVNVEVQGLANALDLAFVTKKLRETCRLLAHNRIYGKSIKMGLIDAVLAWIDQHDAMHIPCIGLYVHVYHMLLEPEEEQHFQLFKTALLQYGQQFQLLEIQFLYFLAINYGIQRVNSGDTSYFRDILDFYQEGLNQGYILKNGRLSRFTYHNIVSVALQIDEVDWAETFIEGWTNKLNRRYQERMYSFNQAKIAYHRKEYDTAIAQLQRSNYHDVLLNLGARTLLVKIYFEVEAFDALHSQLDAFQTYLRRKSDLGYHRTNYQNFIRYLRKTLKINPTDKQAKKLLTEQIQSEKILTEKNWLVAQLE